MNSTTHREFRDLQNPSKITTCVVVLTALKAIKGLLPLDGHPQRHLPSSDPARTGTYLSSLRSDYLCAAPKMEGHHPSGRTSLGPTNILPQRTRRQIPQNDTTNGQEKTSGCWKRTNSG